MPSSVIILYVYRICANGENSIAKITTPFGFCFTSNWTKKNNAVHGHKNASQAKLNWIRCNDNGNGKRAARPFFMIFRNMSNGLFAHQHFYCHRAHYYCIAIATTTTTKITQYKWQCSKCDNQFNTISLCLFEYYFNLFHIAFNRASLRRTLSILSNPFSLVCTSFMLFVADCYR